MDGKDILIILLCVFFVGTVVFGGLGNFFGQISGFTGMLSNITDENQTQVEENISSEIASDNNNNTPTTVNEENTLSSTQDSSSSGSSSEYDDWQKDYETGMVDEDGNPIYKSVISTSGGQLEPGIYETYWSANGPINQTKIG